ncbi:DNA repair protein RecO [Stenotrophomonas sp. CFBP 13718]|uniref:DNA repair protein RecO n=1 Tax=Stenotrophomonas sp. CFBP 13718 TaxID=2775304 RepID=UPI00177C5FF9|nr:DNA repair protein RecO [Stenotrophomonas sp. CFBP 13718]MBD8696135.1 DNA repair protein RecO [Stenotrophomonas sp. CFBP 13718]
MLIAAEPGFVLHARAYRETSLLVDVLTVTHGRLGLLARGVSSAKGQVLRAALQPLQWIRFDAVQRGELAQLRAAEALDAAPRLAGHTMLAGFYVSELVMRLAPRNDAVPDLYRAYGEVRARLGLELSLAWSLRRFERDLLESLGVGFDLACADDGVALDPAARYELDPQDGPRRLLSERDGQGRRGTATGAALLALGHDKEPAADDLASLRLPMRTVLAHHLGGRGLKSWEMLDDLARRR